MTDILKGKCPRCRKGEIFQSSPFNFLKFHKMHEHCPVCHQTFHPEPGFYFGAMYISYAFSVAWVMAVCLILFITDTFSLVRASVIVSVGIILLLPIFFQFSRILFLYGFGGIRKE